MAGQRKIRVAVVFGGRSTEHAVSCASASLVLAALDPERYEVLPIGITRDGRWVLTTGDPGRISSAGSPAGELPSVEAVDASPGTSVVPLPGPGSLQVVSPGMVPRSLGEVDVVLPLLHGAYGEDGTLQGLLELTGTRYAGAGVLASAAGMDKEYMKLILTAHGLPVGRYVVVRDRDWRPGSVERKRVLDEIAELGLPVFVKPARGGSSIGISRVRDLADLESAVDLARSHDPKVLVEAAVDGVEVECAVLEGVDGGPPEASVPGEVLVDAGSAFYDFEAKYLASGDTMRIPAGIPAAAAAEVRRLACLAFDAISCEGLARVDFFCTPAGKVLVNEINTMPGMTAASGFPLMWAATGLPMPALMDRIIRTAMAKRPGLRLSAARRAGRVRRDGESGAGRTQRTAARRTRSPDAAVRYALRPSVVDWLDAVYFFFAAGVALFTRALKSAPARNLGTEDAGTLMVAPVAGLRAVRAGRSLFSNTPKPVMDTLSPWATADWMVSSTAFTASVADFLSPIRSEIASIRSRLFIVHSCGSPTGGRAGSGIGVRDL
jgi:D-alanine-D-alanine ligase